MQLILDPSASDDIEVTASPLLPLPDDQRAWIEDALRADALELISDAHDRTRTGWPVRIVITRAGETWRAHAFYAFFEHAAIGIVIARSHERVMACVDLLRTGRPLWTTDAAALVELWDAPEGAAPV